MLKLRTFLRGIGNGGAIFPFTFPFQAILFSRDSLFYIFFRTYSTININIARDSINETLYKNYLSKMPMGKI